MLDDMKKLWAKLRLSIIPMGALMTALVTTGCERPASLVNIPGTYRAANETTKGVLIIKKDGTYTMTASQDGLNRETRGVWAVEVGGDMTQLTFSNWIDSWNLKVIDTAITWATESKSAEASVSITWDEDLGLVFRQSE